jgi:hypothetical protein
MGQRLDVFFISYIFFDSVVGSLELSTHRLRWRSGREKVPPQASASRRDKPQLLGIVQATTAANTYMTLIHAVSNRNQEMFTSNGEIV